MKRDICIIVQGPTVKDDVATIKESWKGFDIIFSTWEDADKSSYEGDDIVIYNKYPMIKRKSPDGKEIIEKFPGNGNINYQVFSTFKGIDLAKQLGYKRVLKWRNDFITNNGKGLISLFKKNHTNFYAILVPTNYPNNSCIWCGQSFYFTDFFMEGDTDDMYNLFNFYSNGLPFAEHIITQRCYELKLTDNINFICKDLTADINIYWKKHNYWLTDNRASNKHYHNHLTLGWQNLQI